MFVLKSGKFRIIQIKKKTQAQFFSTLNKGDIIELSLPLKAPGRGRSGLYATYITVTNVKTGTKGSVSINSSGVLDNFEYESVREGVIDEQV